MSASTGKWSAVYRRRQDVVTRRVAGETIIVPVRGDIAGMQRIYTLNAVGACVWEAMDGDRSLGEIRGMVLARFDAAEEEAERDLLEFVGRIEEEGLAEVLR